MYDYTGDRSCSCYAGDLEKALDSGTKDLIEKVSKQTNKTNGKSCLSKITCDCSAFKGHCEKCVGDSSEGAYSPPTSETGGVIGFCGKTMDKYGNLVPDLGKKVRDILMHELKHAQQCGALNSDCSQIKPEASSCIARLRAEFEARRCSEKFGVCSDEYVKRHGNNICLLEVFDSLVKNFDDKGNNHALCPGCEEVLKTGNGDRLQRLLNTLGDKGEKIADWDTGKKCF